MYCDTINISHIFIVQHPERMPGKRIYLGYWDIVDAAEFFPQLYAFFYDHIYHCIEHRASFIWPQVLYARSDNIYFHCPYLIYPSYLEVLAPLLRYISFILCCRPKYSISSSRHPSSLIMLRHAREAASLICCTNEFGILSTYSFSYFSAFLLKILRTCPIWFRMMIDSLKAEKRRYNDANPPAFILHK